MTRSVPLVARLLWLAVIIVAVAPGVTGASGTAVAESAFERELFAPPMDTLYDDRVQAESAHWLSVRLFNVPIDHARAADASQFTIVSPDDPAYAADKAMQPAETSSRTRAIRVAERKDMLVKGTAIFLKLPTPMRNGMTYEVRIADLGADVPALPPLVFHDRRQVNDNIRVNQLGYLPGFAKVAYLGQYMGSGGGMPFDVEQFELLDHEGERVHTGRITPRAVNNELVGQVVFELDFTDFQPADDAGPFRLFVPGVGLSYPFDIGAAALNPGYANLMRGHYHQRCGMAVDPAHSRHHRAACHLDDAYLDEKVETLNFVSPENPPLYPTRYGRQQRATRGHHDAGDYGKYTITGAVYTFSILNAMHAFPERLREDNLGLPDSGNGIPDLLEEVKWELDWLEQMQDPDDGGVFGVIKPNTGGYEQDLPLESAERLFYPKDTVFTGAFAAALAHASQSPLMRKHYPDACDRYLEKAIQAWQFLEANDRYVKYFHYGSTFDDWDERCWAAVALYAATGEQAYHDYFLEHFDPQRKRWDWWPLTGKVGHATYTYLFMEGRPQDPAMLERCRTAVREACEKYIADAAAHPYRLSMPGESISHGTYGWYFPGDMFGYDLLMGYALDDRREYLETALHNLNYTMGANPFGYFQQTGLGHKRNIEVVDQESVHDDIVEPVPGLPLGVGSHGFYWLNRYERTVAEGTYPENWPLLNRWYDGFNVSTEFTMGPMARETVVAAFFASLDQEPAQPPTVSIQADHLRGAAPLEVTFEAVVDAPASRVRQVFWDFDDESFSTQAAPVHGFDVSGREYTVTVTVIDDRGRLAYDQVQVGVDPDATAMPVQPFEPDEHTLLLYHLDGDLDDASGHAVTLTPVERDAAWTPEFIGQPLTWMAEPAGACLRLNGQDQFAVTLPRELIPSDDTPLTLEMLVYVEAFTAWGFSGDPLLFGLLQDWNLWFGLRQETWDRALAPALASGADKAVASADVAEQFPMNRWCHVKLVYDPAGEARLFIDGEQIGQGPAAALQASHQNPVRFTLGPFQGKVDEIRVSTIVRE